MSRYRPNAPLQLETPKPTHQSIYEEFKEQFVESLTFQAPRGLMEADIPHAFIADQIWQSRGTATKYVFTSPVFEIPPVHRTPGPFWWAL